MKKTPPDLAMILENLGNGPGLLRSLVDRIPASIRRDHRIPGKWCIHSHACHIVDVQPMLTNRLRRFLAESSPAFVPYIPEGEDGEIPLLAMDLDERLDSFPALAHAIAGPDPRGSAGFVG